MIERPIETEWLIQYDKPLIVTIPDINSITGEKLTAFAPNTTGVPYGAEKEKEIIKHLFDIGCLFELITDIEILKLSFQRYAKQESEYRPERKISSIKHVLKDTIDTSILIANKDLLKNDVDKARFKEINTGINQFGHYVFAEKFGILEAQVASSKAAYLAAIILTDYKGELKRFSSRVPLTEYMITNPDYNFLNKRLKFVAQGEALFYWHQTIK